MKIISRQIEELESLFAEFRTTDKNPCGGSVYYDEDEETALPDESGKPWRVHYADGCEDDSFRTAAESEHAINAYVEDARAENHPDGCSCGSLDCPQWQSSQERA